MKSGTEINRDGTFLSSLRGKIVIFATLVLILVALFCLFLFKMTQHITELSINQHQTVLLESVRTLRIAIGLFGIFFTLIIILTVVWIIIKANRSIRIVLEFLQRLASGDTDRVKISTQDEMATLIRIGNQIATNLYHASVFTKQIGEGNLKENFEPVSDRDILGNSLVQMRDKLNAIAEEDSRRNWATRGLASFGDLLRKYAEDYKALTDNVILELVKYVQGNQGGLFVLNADSDTGPFLELQSFYAYSRKKYMTKKLAIGEGLVGQCFLEKNTIFLKAVPADYTYITSGLGDGVPSSILIVPMIANDVVEGVIELASFQVFQPHEIKFVEKICEQMAVMITSVKVRDRTKTLLEQSQQQTEEMRAQEEEVRQNIEELQATQDHLQRQTDEMRKIQNSLEVEKSMFQVLLEHLPDRITYKDTESRILRVNKAKALRMKMKPEEVEGKTDFDFFTKEHAEKAMKEERELIKSGRALLNIEERLTFGKEVNWVSTSRIPFKNEHNKITGMFIITKDITQLRLAEMALQDFQKIKNILINNLPFIEFKINQDGILSNVHAGQIKFSSPWDGKHVRNISSKMFKIIQEGNTSDRMIDDKVMVNDQEVSCRYCLVKVTSEEGVFTGLMLLNV